MQWPSLQKTEISPTWFLNMNASKNDITDQNQPMSLECNVFQLGVRVRDQTADVDDAGFIAIA